ncbi:MAG: Uncharacterised protein [Cryomorphaceae bacterium]|nr:MAG: Uncharacterised protein [Cryomorphaceae bacterium]
MLMSRPFAEMIPAVTVLVKLNGFPTARTHCPRRTWSELATVTFFKPEASIFNNAMSVVGSVPTSVAEYSSLFAVVTVISFASLIT